MDWQILFNGTFAFVSLVITGYVKFVQVQLNDARALATESGKTLATFQIKVAENYVTHTDLRRIEDALVRIEAKMDVKQDK